jgi:hypothetical protein
MVELPFVETVPRPDDWNDPLQRERWARDRADALDMAYEDLEHGGHVPADRLSVEAWRRLLPADVERKDMVRIEGGLALLDDDVPVLFPTCCIWVDEATEEWRQVAEGPPEEWTMLWIGHPWVLVQGRGDTLMITEPTESTEGDDLAVLAEVGVAELGQALQKARSDAEIAAPHLAEALSSHPTAQDTARRALGLG